MKTCANRQIYKKTHGKSKRWVVEPGLQERYAYKENLLIIKKPKHLEFKFITNCLRDLPKHERWDIGES